MKLLKFDVTGLVRALIGQAAAGPTGGPALVQIVIQVIRASK